MTSSTHLYSQLFDHLRQHSRARDLRHLKALAWMVSALICSGQLSLSEWEAYVQKEGKQSASRGAALAAIYGECADSSKRDLSAFSAGGIAGMAGASIVRARWTRRCCGIAFA